MPALSENKELEILLNGRRLVTPASALAELVACQGLAGQKIATAVNGRFVPEPQRATTRLVAGDRVEIVSPRQGG